MTARSGGKDAGAWICGLGMMTPVGDCAAQTAASVRAGICRYAESEIVSSRFEPMKLALLPEAALPPLDPVPGGWSDRQARMLRLALPALAEALGPLPKGRKVPLLLAGPETLPGQPAALPDGFLAVLLESAVAAGRVDAGASRLLPTGRAGGLQALGEALALLQKGVTQYALVGGVDSWFDEDLLRSLDEQGRVLADGVMDGFAPGEGAGFVLLCADAARKDQRAARVRVHAPGLADEPGNRHGREPYRGEGLAAAVAAALVGSSAPVASVWSSLNGENLGAREWGVAALRRAGGLAPDHGFEHPADCFGDLGAAFAPVLIGLAALGLQRGHVAGPALVYCSSEFAPRGAVRLSLG